MKIKLQKLTYAQMHSLLGYISLARSFRHDDQHTQLTVRRLVFALYARLGRRHIVAQVSARFTVSIEQHEASALCLYVGWRGATTDGHTDEVVNSIYRTLNQYMS